MERTKTFSNGSKLYPADVNLIEDRAAEMLEGLAAAIPTSHFAGRFYRSTDTKTLYIDNGTEWEPFYPNLYIKNYSTNTTVQGSEIAKMTKTGTTVTLPGASLNKIVGVICGEGEITVKKSVFGDLIYGDFINGAATIKLTLNGHVVLQSDGTNWYIIAGSPINENAYGALISRVVGTEYEPSPTRPTFVSLRMQNSGALEIEIKVGGVEIAQIAVGGGSEGIWSYSFICPPKQKWKVESAKSVASTYLTL